MASLISSSSSSSSSYPLSSSSSSKRQRTEQTKEENLDDKIPVQVNLVVITEEAAFSFVTKFTTTLQHWKKIALLIDGIEERENYHSGGIVSFLDPKHDYSGWKSMSEDDSRHMFSKKELEEIEEIVGEESFERDFVQYKVSDYIRESDEKRPVPAFSVTRVLHEWL